jgi:hypothetical protein
MTRDGEETTAPAGNDDQAADVVDDQAALGAPLRQVTDEQLNVEGYNCGNTGELIADGAPYSYDSQIEFLNQNPQTRENIREFHINHPQWGLGQPAWNFLMDNGIENANTSDEAVVEGDPEMNRYAQRVHRLELIQPRDYVNFTCSDRYGNPIEVSAVGNVRMMAGGERNHVSGILISAELRDEFVGLVNKPGGQMMVDILNAGEHEINGQRVELVMVVLEAFGCNNPIRIRHPKVTVITAPPGLTPITVTVPDRRPPEEPPKEPPKEPPPPPPPPPGGKQTPPTTTPTPRPTAPPPTTAPERQTDRQPGRGDSGAGAPPDRTESPPTTQAPAERQPDDRTNDPGGNPEETPTG